MVRVLPLHVEPATAVQQDHLGQAVARARAVPMAKEIQGLRAICEEATRPPDFHAPLHYSIVAGHLGSRNLPWNKPWKSDGRVSDTVKWSAMH